MLKWTRTPFSFERRTAKNFLNPVLSHLHRTFGFTTTTTTTTTTGPGRKLSVYADVVREFFCLLHWKRRLISVHLNKLNVCPLESAVDVNTLTKNITDIKKHFTLLILFWTFSSFRLLIILTFLFYFGLWDRLSTFGSFYICWSLRLFQIRRSSLRFPPWTVSSQR